MRKRWWVNLERPAVGAPFVDAGARYVALVAPGVVHRELALVDVHRRLERDAAAQERRILARGPAWRRNDLTEARVVCGQRDRDILHTRWAQAREIRRGLAVDIESDLPGMRGYEGRRMGKRRTRATRSVTSTGELGATAAGLRVPFRPETEKG